MGYGVEQKEAMKPEAAQPGLTLGRAAAAMGLGVALILLTALVIRSTEMVTGRYFSHGVPPLPAFAAVLLLSLLRPVLRRYAPRLVPTRAQILLVYVMLTIATVLSGCYQIRAFLPHLVSMQYQGRDGGVMQDYAAYLPSWLAPRDKDAILHYYEGAPGGAVPWGVWAGPLFWWSLFLAAIFLAGFSFVTLVRKRWLQEERLTFPLLAIPLAVAADDWNAYGSPRGRRAVFLIGFGIAALYNGVNILHVLYPPAPTIGFYIPLAPFFQERPWTPLGSVYIFFFLEAIGIGYFVPLEITFSIWFFYLLNRLLAVGGTMIGYDEPGFPFTQEQSAGGYLAMGLLLLWGLRRSFAESLRRAFGPAPRDRDTSEERWAWIGLAASVLFVLGFCWRAGLSLWLAVAFFGVLALFVVVVARIRAETGVPLGFVYPYALPKETLLNAVSVPHALGLGGTGSFVLLSSLAWLSRHHFAQEQVAYQLDGAKIASENRIPRRTLLVALLVAFGVGLAAAYWVHLSAYYALGSNMAAGGQGGGEFRGVVAQQEYQQMASRLANPPARHWPRLLAGGGGFLFVSALCFLRAQMLRLPLHPLGFLLATAYGDSLNAWFAAFVAWACKAVILRAGGLMMYRRGMPLFLGLAIGHFFMAGIFWPVLSLFIAPEASQSYHLYFAG